MGKGGMAALIGATVEIAREIAAEAAQGDVCVAANDNAPGQVVISGSTAAIDRAVEIAGKKGLKRAVKLAVSAPFHSPMMQPAAVVMEQALAAADIKDLRFPVIANVTAAPVVKADDIRKLLTAQVTGRSDGVKACCSLWKTASIRLSKQARARFCRVWQNAFRPI